MKNYTRQQLIDAGIYLKKDAGVIDKTLQKYGHKGLTLAEFNKISPIQNIGKDIGRNIKENVAGIKTAAGAIAKSVAQGTVIEDAKKILSNPEAIADAMLSPYNVSIEKIRTGQVSPWGIAQGIKEHPVDATLDAWSFGNSKLLKAGYNTLADSKAVKNIAKTSKTAENIRRAVLPTTKERKLNEALTALQVDQNVAKKTTRGIQDQLQMLYGKKGFDPEQVVKNVRLGTELGSDATKKGTELVKQIVRSQADDAIKYGLLEEQFHRANTIAQRMNDVLPDMTHAMAMKYLDDISKGVKVPEAIAKVAKESSDLYDQGKLAYISQALHPTAGFGSDTSKAHNLFEQVRVGGKTLPKELAPILPETFRYVDSQLGKSQLGLDGLNHLYNNYAYKLDSNAIKNIKAKGLSDDFVLLSKSSLDNAIKGSATRGGRTVDNLIRNADDTNKILEGIYNGTLKKIPDDIYIVNKKNLYALSNLVKGLKTNRAVSFIKRSILPSLKWVVENRLTNLPNNIMAGVGLREYMKTNPFSKAFKNAPSQLDELTSYSGYSGGSLHKMNIRQAKDMAISKFKRAAKDKKPIDMVEAVNELFGIWFTRPEALLEKWDRYANFYKHAEDYAKSTGKAVDEVVELSRKDPSVFWNLYSKTNKELGDYLGRNYLIDNKFYEGLNNVYLFWKYPAQSARIIMNQITEHPYKYQAMVNLPTRMGREEWDRIKKKYRLSPDDYTGGVVYREPRNITEPLKLVSPSFMQQVAVGDLTSLLFGQGEGRQLGLNPFLQVPYRTLVSQTDIFGNPLRTKGTFYDASSRRLYDINDKGIVLGDEHKYTPSEMTGIALNELLNTAFTPKRLSEYLFRPLLKYEANYPRYANVINPFEKGNVYMQPKEGMTENVGRQLGVPIVKTYPEFKMKPSQIKRLSKKVKKKYIQNKRGK